MDSGLEEVKAFVRGATTSSTALRRALIDALVCSAARGGLPPAAVKLVVRALGSTLFRYSDAGSRRAVLQAFESFCTVYGPVAVGSLCSVVEESCRLFPPSTSSPASANTGLTVLRWSCVAVAHSSEPTYALLHCQATLLAAMASCPRKGAWSTGLRVLSQLWGAEPRLGPAYLSCLLAGEPFPSGLCLLAALARHSARDSTSGLEPHHQEAMLDYFVKAVLCSRVRPPEAVVTCSLEIFRLVSRAQFSSLLLQPALKCLLRNPDELLHAVAVMTTALPLDCSLFAEDFLRNTIPHLSSPLPGTRRDALALVRSLAGQCSDGGPVQSMLALLLPALRAAPGGTVTVAEHRGSVLAAIEALSQCPLSAGSQEALAAMAVDGLAVHIKQEVHLGTAVSAVDSLRCWCGLLPEPVPGSLLKLVKDSLGSKGTAPQLRAAYLRCVLELCRGGDAASERLSGFMPLIVQSLERGLASSVQPAALDEALAATHLLLTLGVGQEAGLGRLPEQLWQIVDSERLVSNKLLSTSSHDTLEVLVEVADRIFAFEEKKLKEGVDRLWLRAVLSAVPRLPWPARKKALAALSCAGRSQSDWSLLALDELEALAVKADSSKALLLALYDLAPPTHPARAELAVRSLLLAHHPALSAGTPRVWQRLMGGLGLEPRPFVTHSMEPLLSAILNNIPSHPEACSRSLRTLLRLCEEGVCAGVVERVCTVLATDEVLRVSQEEMEILQTPPNELWHRKLKSELLGAVYGAVEANVRRESRAYSYEDQVWDAQVRRELQRRRGAEQGGGASDNLRGLVQQAKLSQKQKESIEAQLSYECAVRGRLSTLDHTLDTLVWAVEHIRGRGLVCHTPSLASAVLRALPSPLAREHCRGFWRALVLVVLPDWETAHLFAETSLRVLTSPSAPPPAPLPRLLASLEQSPPSDSALLAATLSLTLPLLAALRCQTDWHQVQDDAVKVLCRMVECHTPSSGEPPFPVLESLRLLSAVLTSAQDTARGIRTKKACVSAYVGLCCSLAEPGLPPEALGQLTSDLCLEHGDLRHASLEGLSALGAPVFQPDCLPLHKALLVARYDVVDGNRELANRLWEVAGYGLPPSLCAPLLDQLAGSCLALHVPTAQALGVWLQANRAQASAVLDRLVALYRDKCTAPPPAKDSFGRTLAVQYRDEWESRVGVAHGLGRLPLLLSPAHCMTLLLFLIPEALADCSSLVRDAMMEAAREAIAAHGEALSSELMAHFEQSLSGGADSREADALRQAIVVLMGALAKHMDKENPKVKAVVHLLLGNLDTPSQQVQEAVAGCLPPLVPVVKTEAEAIISKLMEKLLEASSYSQRHGAAYGLASIVKGLGIPTLKQFGVMAALQEAIKDKKVYRHREGALLAFGCLCDALGRLFEPYVVHLLPDLLLCFGDGNQYVREATDRTARTIMAHLSSHGVKLILPSLLTALEEDSWRTKAGSAELLGAMAFCAPRQLSSCLPTIVPKLMAVLADSHAKVQSAGAQALRHIGSVIKNPEIQALVPLLLEALTEPSRQAPACLQALLETEFVHVVDAPSLALIMPTLKRALEVRSTDTKKMAAQIVGNLYSLTERRELAPYLRDVLPGLQQSLVDPVPEVRGAAAKALGAMVRGMEDECLTQLLPWLMATLQSEASSVDRSGAAQGLSEVLLAQGAGHLGKLMPRIVETSQSGEKPAHVRDGYLMLLIYLPIAFGEQFMPYISTVLPPILKGLSDESEFIRETSLQAGQVVISRYAESAVELFLPELEAGLSHHNWRIRCSSVQLLGDLLFQVSGLSGKMSTESAEDDNFGTEEARKALIRILGAERRNRVLAGLYMGRSDVALVVRQAALHVWKVVVTNTGRTLREILPTLVQLLLSCLASAAADKRQVAARTLGDLVRKLGERVLPEVIPMLEQGLQSEEPRERQGVCIGLSEIVQQTSRDNVLLYVESLLPTVRRALCDPEEEVRAAAATTFDSLHTTIGHRMLDEVLSPLLQELAAGDQGGVALDGLRQVMGVKSRVVLPHIVPQLIAPPVNGRALALLCSVAGEALYKHLDRIIPALVAALCGEEDSDTWQAAEAVVLSVQTEPGPAILLEQLTKEASRTAPAEQRAAAMALLLAMAARSSADLSEHIPQLLIFTTEAMNSRSDSVATRAWLTLEATIKRVSPKELPHFTGFLRKALRTVSSDLYGEELHGFALKGIGPVLQLLKEGLISGSPDEKEEAAKVLIDVIHLTSANTLSTGKVVMLIAGPLIRVLGDRYGWSVKVATLEALVELVRKVGAAAKAFIPQLQTSYLKALNDPNKPVRVQAVTGLTELLPLSPRVDPVFNDLHNGVKKNEDPSLRLTMLQALHGAVLAGGQRMAEKARREVLSSLVALENTAQEGSRLEAASCLGALCTHLSHQELTVVLRETVLVHVGVADWAVLQARATVLGAAVASAAARIRELDMEEEVVEAARAFAGSDRVPVCISGLSAAATCLSCFAAESSCLVPTITQALCHSAVDVRVAASEACCSVPEPPSELLAAALPPLLANTRDKNTAVKAAAERAIVAVAGSDQGLKRCLPLVEGALASRLEEVVARALARQSRGY